jgi:polyisoprenoid-binding protein YceI
MRTIRFALVCAALVTVPSCLAAKPQLASKVLVTEAKTYTVSKLYTTLSFTATKWLVFKEEGVFQDFNGTLTYSASDPAKCSIEVTVQAASLDTRSPGRDNVLRSDDFFDVEKFPTLSFHSTKVTSNGTDSYHVQGNLMIHGVTKNVNMPVKMIGARVMPGMGDFAGLETTFTIDRREFGVLGNRWSGNKVAIDPTVVIHLLIGGVRDMK